MDSVVLSGLYKDIRRLFKYFVYILPLPSPVRTSTGLASIISPSFFLLHLIYSHQTRFLQAEQHHSTAARDTHVVFTHHPRSKQFHSRRWCPLPRCRCLQPLCSTAANSHRMLRAMAVVQAMGHTPTATATVMVLAHSRHQPRLLAWASTAAMARTVASRADAPVSRGVSRLSRRTREATILMITNDNNCAYSKELSEMELPDPSWLSQARGQRQLSVNASSAIAPQTADGLLTTSDSTTAAAAGTSNSNSNAPMVASIPSSPYTGSGAWSPAGTSVPKFGDTAKYEELVARLEALNLPEPEILTSGSKRDEEEKERILKELQDVIAEMELPEPEYIQKYVLRSQGAKTPEPEWVFSRIKAWLASMTMLLTRLCHYLQSSTTRRGNESKSGTCHKHQARQCWSKQWQRRRSLDPAPSVTSDLS